MGFLLSELHAVLQYRRKCNYDLQKRYKWGFYFQNCMRFYSTGVNVIMVYKNVINGVFTFRIAHGFTVQA